MFRYYSGIIYISETGLERKDSKRPHKKLPEGLKFTNRIVFQLLTQQVTS